jgi:hypothetical protein
VTTPAIHQHPALVALRQILSTRDEPSTLIAQLQELVATFSTPPPLPLVGDIFKAIRADEDDGALQVGDLFRVAGVMATATEPIVCFVNLDDGRRTWYQLSLLPWFFASALLA